MATVVFDELIHFVERLQRASISYSVNTIRDNALMVTVVVPGQRWEIEFFADGTIEVEKFVSDRTIFGEEALTDLFDQFSD